MRPPLAFLLTLRKTKIFIYALAAGIQRGCSFDACREYIEYFGSSQVHHEVNALHGKQWHVLHYAIKRNDPKLVRLLLQQNADPNTSHVAGKVPLLAWAVMISKYTVLNTTEVVKILLEYGADPEAIPSDMWTDYLKEPSAVLQKDAGATPKAAQWCNPGYRIILAETFNLSQRYALFRSHSFKQPTERAKQISEAFGIQGILKIPHTIIGQPAAARMVADQIPAEHAFQMNTPLVMAFAGPSGHGKTELAKQMGDLLNVDSIIVDCTQMRTEWQLFGPPQGYKGCENGSPLNGFIAKNAGKSCVVFLDEFDKTVREVREALLTITENGSYVDRTSNKAVNAKKVIWILATNLGDETIEKQPPFVGRIRLVVPFFPFSLDEQTVIAHKFLLQLVDNVRQPLDLRPSVNRYIGHMHLNLRGDVELARYIAERYYDTDLGARSFAAGIDAVKSKLYKAYTQPEGRLEEKLNNGNLQKFTVGVRARRGEKCGGECWRRW
ncbi:P-loop containing nucleoside triphosphate hydrolase protein [Saccharata proteae CBS 121410]|uniref:P-loop containing nucleoside triphosphate hydrolase protein n=1 Tax=Saccharata proteae CBS 121410 TaxID=1314787 RepID=A0A6A5YEU6_9PEZI|nr:P-loop containing nucleoside triphosphate hydrolase protein [Saccharata proteae CBS 121410]